jgi:hypothetical protein
MHSHNCGCEHNLKHCAHCDVVYCTKCHREWGHQNNWYYYKSWPQWTYCDTLLNTTSSGNSLAAGNTTTTNGGCTHGS